MKVAVIGDNCIDFYKRIDRMYPTGNVVDTGVNLKKLGIDVSLISTTGDDEFGRWMINSMENEEIDISHLNVGSGKTAVTYMDLIENERIHGEYEEGVLESITFDSEDINFAASHDHVHTALWGKAEKVLKDIKKKEVTLSFDYADRLAHQLISETEFYVDYGFFSYHEGRNGFIENFLKERVVKGMKIAVATFGEGGSLAWDGNLFYEGKSIPAKVVNTVGAGDSFIAGFIYGILNNMKVSDCLSLGASVASRVVSVFEPWPEENYEELLENFNRRKL